MSHAQGEAALKPTELEGNSDATALHLHQLLVKGSRRQTQLRCGSDYNREDVGGGRNQAERGRALQPLTLTRHQLLQEGCTNYSAMPAFPQK